jgi:hypothetical protein
MSESKTYRFSPEEQPSILREDGIEYGFIGKLQGLKYEYRRDITDRASLEQIVEYKNDPGNGYTRTLLCFLQLFIVSNREAKEALYNWNTSILSAA